MEDFIKYVSRYDENYPKVIRGATDEEIDTLERAVGRPLPQTYRMYLSSMGHNDGGLELAFEGVTEIDEIIDFYQNEVARGEMETPPDCIVIGVGGLAVEEVSLEISVGQEPRVVFSSGAKIQGLYAESLMKLLYQTAFQKYKPRLMPHTRFYTSSYEQIGFRRMIVTARAVAQSLGFSAHWFSDDVVFCGEKPDMLLILSQYEDSGLAAKVAGQNESQVEETGRILIEQLGLSRG